MFSSADGYCSAAVFSDGELGTKYEKPQQEDNMAIVEEYDVEMMDIPTNNSSNTNGTTTPGSHHEDNNSIGNIINWVKAPQKRRVSSATTAGTSASSTSSTPDIVNITTNAATPTNLVAPNEETPKKRRITPILISTPSSSI